MALVNAGPIAVELLATAAEDDEAGRFLACLVIARVPLFLFQAVQAALLPRLSALASEGRTEELRQGLARLLEVLGGLAAVGVVGRRGAWARRRSHCCSATTSSWAGARWGCSPWAAGRTWWPRRWPRRTSPSTATGAWPRPGPRASLAFAVAVAVASDDLFLRVEVATVVGGVVALAAHLGVLSGLLRSGARFTPGDLVEAITDLPMEP